MSCEAVTVAAVAVFFCLHNFLFDTCLNQTISKRFLKILCLKSKLVF